METLLQVLVGLISAMLAGLGGASIFAPHKMLANFAIQPDGAAGLNTVRGVIGGLFLGSLGLLVFGLVSGQSQWFLAVAAVLGAVAVGRVVGLAADGFTKDVVPPLVLELVMVGVLVGAHSVLGA